MMEVELTLRKLRKKSGLSQNDVAKALNVSQPSVSLWEIGITHPKFAHLKNLAELYGCQVDELMRDEPQKG